MNIQIVDLFHLFWQAGLAVSFAFILGFALGLWVMSYLHRRQG